MKGAILVRNVCLDPLITVTKEKLPNLFVDLGISSGIIVGHSDFSVIFYSIPNHCKSGN